MGDKEKDGVVMNTCKTASCSEPLSASIIGLMIMTFPLVLFFFLSLFADVNKAGKSRSIWSRKQLGWHTDALRDIACKSLVDFVSAPIMD